LRRPSWPVRRTKSRLRVRRPRPAPGRRTASGRRRFGAHSDAELRVVDASPAVPRCARWRGRIRRRSGSRSAKRSSTCVRQVGSGRSAGARFPRAGNALSDVIESGGDRDGRRRRSSTTTQRRRTPRRLGFELIEPLRDLFKDEVRRLGLELEIERQPGLAATRSPARVSAVTLPGRG